MTSTWKFRPGAGEHYCALECGISIYLYRDHSFPAEWLWRISGEHDSESHRTFTNIVPDAKRIAHRGADMLWQKAIEQNKIELALLGTSFVS